MRALYPTSFLLFYVCSTFSCLCMHKAKNVRQSEVWRAPRALAAINRQIYRNIGIKKLRIRAGLHARQVHHIVEHDVHRHLNARLDPKCMGPSSTSISLPVCGEMQLHWMACDQRIATCAPRFASVIAMRRVLQYVIKRCSYGDVDRNVPPLVAIPLLP